MPDWLPTAVALAALGCVIAAAIEDLRRFEIPDQLSIALVALAIAYGALTPGFDWLSHIAAPLAVFAIGLLLFARG
ncbi:prepilin peptidase, partial [Polymorphobacter sp.]|uniref:prepilin peptidase n=1 Tax=Polymorphobacter sp. TaxID=1909290 RepID=UPI003F729457